MHKDPLIVITGAAGMIGSCTVRHLNDLGRVRLILVDDIAKTEKWKNVQGKSFCDWIRPCQLFSWLEGRQEEIGAFIHLGACSDTLETDGDFLLENNYRFSVKLAEYALKYNKRFIYASSAATYGDGALGFSDDHEKLLSLRPLNMYGFSKHLFDLWALHQGVLDQMVGLKYFNVFGPNEDHKGRMSSMVCKMVPLVQKEGVLRLFQSSDPAHFSDGEQCRDFIYVKDAVRLTCLFLDNHLQGIYNIGSGKVTTWNQLARAVFNALDIPPHIDYIPMPPDLARQYQNYTCAEMSKLSSDLSKVGQGTFCTMPIEDAVYEYVDRYLIKGARW